MCNVQVYNCLTEEVVHDKTIKTCHVIFCLVCNHYRPYYSPHAKTLIPRREMTEPYDLMSKTMTCKECVPTGGRLVMSDNYALEMDIETHGVSLYNFWMETVGHYYVRMKYKFPAAAVKKSGNRKKQKAKRTVQTYPASVRSIMLDIEDADYSVPCSLFYKEKSVKAGKMTGGALLDGGFPHGCDRINLINVQTIYNVLHDGLTNLFCTEEEMVFSDEDAQTWFGYSAKRQTPKLAGIKKMEDLQPLLTELSGCSFGAKDGFFYSYELDEAATCIQRHVRGWLINVNGSWTDGLAPEHKAQLLAELGSPGAPSSLLGWIAQRTAPYNTVA